jgi:hypothetical protein
MIWQLHSYLLYSLQLATLGDLSLRWSFWLWTPFHSLHHTCKYAMHSSTETPLKSGRHLWDQSLQKDLTTMIEAEFMSIWMLPTHIWDLWQWGDKLVTILSLEGITGSGSTVWGRLCIIVYFLEDILCDRGLGWWGDIFKIYWSGSRQYSGCNTSIPSQRKALAIVS